MESLRDTSEQSRGEQNLGEQNRELRERLRVLSGAMRAFAVATPNLQVLLETVARRVTEGVADCCVVLLLSEDGGTLVPAAAFTPDPGALGLVKEALSEPIRLETHPVARQVHESGEPFLASKLDIEAMRPPRTTPHFFAFMKQMGVHSLLVVALRGPERSAGQLVLVRFRPGRPPFEAQDVDLALNLADHAALALSNARLLAEARDEHAKRTRIAARLGVLTEASREFSATTHDLEHLLEVVARRLGEIVGDLCAIRTITPDGEWLESRVAAYHRDPSKVAELQALMRSGRQRAGEGISGGVAATRLPLLTAEVDGAAFIAASHPAYRAFAERLGITSAMTLPLLCRGRVVGVANLMRNTANNPYTEDDLQFVQSVAEQAALAIGNARSNVEERAAREVAEKASFARHLAEARFARLFECGIIGILVCDLDGKVFEINATLLDLLGYTREEILSGRVAWRDISPADWREVDARAVHQLTTSGVGALREKEYLRKDGTRVPVLIGSAMTKEGDRNEVISFVLDLTERKEALQRARLAAIVDASDDAIIGSTLEGVITSWNKGAHRLFGYAEEESVGKSLRMIVPPGREDETRPTLEALAHGEGRRFDTVRRKKDGQTVDVSVTMSPVRDSRGVVVGISKVVRDITERRQTEESLARAKDRALAANRELEAFSYSVAHDLRAPLRGMNGFAQVLLEDYADKLDAEGRDCLREIRSNAQKMGALIDALLSLSRVTRSDWRPEWLDLSALFRAALTQVASSDPGRQVTLIVEDGIWARVDPQLTRALCDNLVENCWKFTSHVPEARIEFGATREGDTYTLYIRDNGAGFDMAHATKLFAPFQRVHTVAEFPGTGIGLATVQRIVHRHGGRIWADAKVGKGAVFYFTLPDTSRRNPGKDPGRDPG